MNKVLPRACVYAYDALALFAVAVVLSFAFITPAYAYVDPSVMTYAIQAVAGVAVALSTVLGVAFRRTRKKLFKLLKIDENSNKCVDLRVSRIKPGDAAALKRAEERSVIFSKQVKQGLPARKLTFCGRLVRALVVSVFVSFTLLFVAPFELVAGNGSDLLFGLDSVAPIMAALSAIVALVLTLVLTCLKGKAFDIVLSVLAALGLCFWLEALFLNTGLPGANGSVVDWDEYTTITAISAAVWVVVIAAFVVLAVKKRKMSRIAAVVVSVALVFVQGVGLVGAAAHAGSSSSDVTYKVTQKGLYDVSGKKNVIVFCLDAMDTVELEQIRTEYPDLWDDYTGFTYFNNVVGSGMPTHYGVPFLLSGEYPQYDESWTTYNQQRWNRSTLLSDISDAGYSVGVYSDTFANGLEPVSHIAMNVNADDGQESEAPDTFGTIAAMTKASLYRDMPWLFKAPFWYYTDEINASMKGESGQAVNRDSLDDETYTLNDPKYYSTLISLGLSADDDSQTGAFRFIHLFGSHEPFNMDENAQDTSGGPVTPGTADTSTSFQQTRGALHIVAEYINQLKELGVYDNTTIIVTSDHGRHHVQYDPLDYAMCTSLLIKPAQSAELDARPYQISSVPTGHMDYAAMLETSIGNYDSKYGTQTPFDVADSPRDRYFYMTAWSAVTDWGIREYKINGNALDFANWSLTGVYWDCENYWRSSSDMGKSLSDIDFSMDGAVGPVVQAGPGSNITTGNPDCLQDRQ